MAKTTQQNLSITDAPSAPTSKISSVTGLAAVERLLKASADQLRLEILQVLQHDSFGVLELCNLFAIKQSAMSHHLKVLSNADLVTTRREGNAIFYRRALPGSGENSLLISQLFTSIDAEILSSDLQQAIDRAQKTRSELSLQFFSVNSERFKAQQDLIVDIADYRDTVDEILDTLFIQPALTQPAAETTPAQFAQRETKQAIEIGPGDGSYLSNLSRRFNHVIALDNAEPMLQQCRLTAEQQGLNKVGFILGDTSTFIQLDSEIAKLSPSSQSGARKADCVVANMVLHHNAKPQNIINDVGKLLAPNGVFVVSELCQHDQDWVRDAAGDVWLGFNETLLDNWASNSGLEKGPSSYTALRNGFRIQILSYIKKSG